MHTESTLDELCASYDLDAASTYKLHNLWNGLRWSDLLVPAAACGVTRLVRHLYETFGGINDNAADALKRAAVYGRVGVVRYLCEGRPEYLHDNRLPSVEDNAALRLAAAFGHVGVVRYLCHLADDYGINPAACRNSALRSAVENDCADVVACLCALPPTRGVDPTVDDNYLLTYAAERGFAAIVAHLCELPLARGVDPAAQDNAAVRHAAVNGHVNVAAYLCELPPVRGVDPAADDNYALRWAAADGWAEVVEYLCGLPTHRGVDPAANGCEALQLAARNGHGATTVRLLWQVLEARGQPAARLASLVMTHAAAGGRAALVRAVYEDPRVPLHRRHATEALVVAARHGNLPLVRYLLERPRTWAQAPVEPMEPLATLLPSDEALRRARAVLELRHQLRHEQRQRMGVPDSGVDDGPALFAAWRAGHACVVEFLLDRWLADPAAAADPAVRVDRATNLRWALEQAVWPQACDEARSVTITDEGLRQLHRLLTALMVPSDAATWFAQPREVQPLLAQVFTTATRQPTCDVFRVALATLDAVPTWPRDAVDPDDVVFAARRLLRTALWALCTMRDDAPPPPRRVWRLLRDACSRLVPHGYPLSVNRRRKLAEEAAAAGERLPQRWRRAKEVWAAHLPWVMSEVREHARTTLLVLRTGCDAGRMEALARLQVEAGAEMTAAGAAPRHHLAW